MELDWTSTAVMVAVTIAIVNRIKKEVPVISSFWYTLISLGIGASLYFVGTYAPVTVTMPLTIGLIASGIYDVRQGD